MKPRIAWILLAQAIITRAISDIQISLCQDVLKTNATHSWELGTETEALMELDCAPMSVYGNSPLPPSAAIVPSGVIDIVRPMVSLQPATQAQIITDGSAADPASLGVAVLAANVSVGSTSGVDYLGSATRQLDDLLLNTPRTPDGAISHRKEQIQLWSDFVYMAPPFIAYYGAMSSNETLLQEAYDQCRLYRQYLRYTNGCWQHILDGGNNTSGFNDTGRWATGNAWAAAGMMRVYATILHSAYSSAMASQMSDLATWTNEVQSCAWSNLQSGASLLHNYIDEPGTFLDAASSALMAATTFRYASFQLGSQHVSAAELVYQAMGSAVNTSNGIVSPVVDPLSYTNLLNQTAPNNQTNTTSVSPEAQAFVLLLEAARRDFQASNVSTTAQPSQMPIPSSSSPTQLPTSTSRAAAPSLQPLPGLSSAFWLALALTVSGMVGGIVAIL